MIAAPQSVGHFGGYHCRHEWLVEFCYVFPKLRKLSIRAFYLGPRIFASMHNNEFCGGVVRVRKSMTMNCAISPLNDIGCLKFSANSLQLNNYLIGLALFFT